MEHLSPVGTANQAVSWTGTSWAPQQQLITPGWQFQRENGTTFRLFPITDNYVRFASGSRYELGASNGTAISLNLSNEFVAVPFATVYVYFSSEENRVHTSELLPTLLQGVYHYPGRPNFICLGRIHLNASGQMEDTDTHRGVVSLYNQGPRSIRFAPQSSDQGQTAGQSRTVSSVRFTSAFPGALVDLTAFGQVGATSPSSYSRASFSHDATATSTVGGDSPTVGSHSLRSITSATGSGQLVNLNVRCESGVTMVVGNANGLQGRGIIYHNW